MRHTQADEATCELSALYALGALDTEEARAYEHHLAEGCEACATEVEEFGATCFALAQAAPEAAPPEAARGKLLSRVSAETRRPSANASDLLVVRAGEGEWFETEDSGVFVKLLYADCERETVTTLVRMSPGSRIPRHRHRGAEQCLVLEGDVSSGPHTLSAGDFNCALAGSVHDELTSVHGALLLIVSPESYEVLSPRA
jgi:anti-sigma factor ChrR (cupin superfamily)